MANREERGSSPDLAAFIAKLHKQAGAVYLACESEVAKDISESLSHAAMLLTIGARSETTARIPADVRDFIYHVTLHLQSHRSTTEAQKDAMFQNAYRLYVQYDVEGERNKEQEARLAAMRR